MRSCKSKRLLWRKIFLYDCKLLIAIVDNISSEILIEYLSKIYIQVLYAKNE